MTIEKNEITDATLQVIKEGGDPNADPNKGGDKPFTVEKEVHEKAITAQKSLDGLLEKHGFETVDEVIDALESGSTLAKKLGDKDLDAIIKAADTLEGYEAIWAADEAKIKKEDETDDDRIAILEKEIKAFKDEQLKKEATSKAAKESQAALEAYEATVANTAKESDIPEGQLPFFKEFMGINNPVLDIELDDKAAVRKVMKNQSKKYNDFVQTIIKGYTDGKIKLVEIKPAEPVVPDKPEAKNLKEARKMAIENLKGFFNKS